MKKTFAILLSIVLMLSLAVPAMAEEETTETYSITINNEAEGHTYEAYQIFAGDLAKEGENEAGATNAVLSNIVWGKGISEAGQTAMGNAAEKAKTLTADNITAFAKQVAEYLTSPSSSANTVSDGKYIIRGLEPGYYLVKDQNNSLDGDDDSYTSYIIEVVENSVVTPKSSKPSVQKKVDDENDSVVDVKDGDNLVTDGEDTVRWEDSADHDIGDSVKFQLKATLADNVSAYDTYKVVFHDTLSKGLTYNDASYKVYLGDGEDRKDITSTFAINVGAYSEEDGTEITFTCNDVTAEAVGAGNKDIIVVEYTATLNEKAVLGSEGNPNKVSLEYSNNPNWKPGTDEDEEDSPTGKTPEDEVIVFTYKVEVKKTDGANPLPGAEFTLEKLVNGEWKALALVKDEAGTTFTFEGLDDGQYRLTEDKAPEGFNLLSKPIYFTVTAEHEVESDDPKLTNLSASETDENGANLTEGIVAQFSVIAENVGVSTTIVNKAGATLPETGGIGTTIFYVVGGVLLVGAVVLLVTKKRMSAEG